MENSHERGKDFGLEVKSDFILNSLYRNDNSFVSPLSKDFVSTRCQLRVGNFSNLMSQRVSF